MEGVLVHNYVTGKRVEKSKESINKEGVIFNFCKDGGKILKNNKRDSSFIREMRVLGTRYLPKKVQRICT